jgi:dTDP-4-dehydrorhamnose 3,5-epimerase
MQVSHFSIHGPVLITPRVFSDNRGCFTESYKARAFNDAVGRNVTFVQDNQSLSKAIGTVRALHYQSPPHAQGKLVRVLHGRIIDIIVDVRLGSPTFGQFVRVELNAKKGQQLWVPEGFLHGFSTLEANTIVFYKVTAIYMPNCDGSVRFDSLDIDWGLTSTPILSHKDCAAPAFVDWESPFHYNEAPR